MKRRTFAAMLIFGLVCMTSCNKEEGYLAGSMWYGKSPGHSYYLRFGGKELFLGETYVFPSDQTKNEQRYSYSVSGDEISFKAKGTYDFGPTEGNILMGKTMITVTFVAKDGGDSWKVNFFQDMGAFGAEM